MCHFINKNALYATNGDVLAAYSGFIKHFTMLVSSIAENHIHVKKC